MNRRTTRFLLRFAAFVLLSQAFFLAFFVGSRQLSPDPIVYYAGLRSLGYSAALLLGGLWLLRILRPSVLDWFTTEFAVPAVLVHVLLGYAFVITIPSLLDRSISVYLIAAVARSGPDGLSRAELQSGFLRDYVEGTATIDKRLNEQLASKDVVENNGRFVITPRGQFVYEVNRSLARVFRIPPKYTEPSDPREQTAQRGAAK